MANNKSAKKRIKINKRNNTQNNSYKSLIKTYKKKFLIAAESYSKDLTENNKTISKEYLTLSISQIDKAVKKKIIHKNTAARKKSNLYKKFSMFQTL
uniref:30S ribosomal protein S20 n=2 Tax=Fucus TaxID=3011 RepID=A0A2R4QPU4_9PHAE|nr:30S ribosomal protein S20 [Fucus vesiculosus]AVZ00564.1 30S ribosomal protein S20 [Fucus spiralis]CAX12424.1 30S ribosomal protein S20 [Fucus vesiculosus]